MKGGVQFTGKVGMMYCFYCCCCCYQLVLEEVVKKNAQSMRGEYLAIWTGRDVIVIIVVFVRVREVALEEAGNKPGGKLEMYKI